jgi:hypothetical protein
VDKPRQLDLRPHSKEKTASLRFSLLHWLQRIAGQQLNPSSSAFAFFNSAVSNFSVNQVDFGEQSDQTLDAGPP